MNADMRGRDLELNPEISSIKGSPLEIGTLRQAEANSMYLKQNRIIEKGSFINAVVPYLVKYLLNQPQRY